MKVSIVSVNRVRMPELALPVGPAVVAAVLRREGHEVRILDLCHEPSPDQAIVSHLEAWRPDLVGISLRNLENNQMIGNQSFLGEAKQAVERIRSTSSCPIVLGGAGYSLFSDELLEALDVRYGLAGEAEESVPALLRCIERRQVPRDVPGACHRGDGEVVEAPAAKLDDLAGGILPAFDLLDCAPYVALDAPVPIETKRGCDLACAFCPEGADREGARLKPVVQAVDEIEAATRHVGTSRLFFTDSIFQYPPDHAMALCQEMTRRRLDLRWSAGVNPVGLSRELLAAMKDAGCFGVGLSVDALTDDTLRRYRKGFDQADIERTVGDLRAVGIPFVVFTLFGGPGETPESVIEGLDFLDSLAHDEPAFHALGLRVFKGTPLEASARDEGLIEPGHNMLTPTYYLSKDLDESVLGRLEEYCASRPRWIALPTLINLAGQAPDIP